MEPSSPSSTSETRSPAAGGSSTSLAPRGERRVLNLYVRAGVGHEVAARAVERAMREVDPGSEPLVRDALDFASRLFQAFYASSYNRVASRAPRMWGFVYNRSERQRYHGVGHRLRLAFNAWNCRGFEHAALALRPRAILCTQFLPAEIFARMREQGRLSIPVYCAITDFSVHPIWVYRGVDRYFVATEVAREELADTGEVSPDRIEVSGVPIHPQFATTVGAPAARAELGLDVDPARPTLLIMGGGFGWGPIEGMLEIVLGLPHRVQALVVAGRNPALRARLAERVRGHEARIKIHGFTDRVALFLEAADLLIGKAGGLTSSEAMARAVPMVVFRPIPGQEERNCDFLQESGAAVRVHDLDELHFRLRHFLSDPEHLLRMRAAAARVGRPRSAYQVAGSILSRLTPSENGARMP